MRFFAASPDALLPTTTTEYLMFSVGLAAKRGLDLTRQPFVKRRSKWVDKRSWDECQAFGVLARRIDAQLIRYESARDEASGFNIALFDPDCFTAPVPSSAGTWHFRFQNRRLVVFGASPSQERHEFDFGQFGLTN
jgi:hypothetical protein